MVTITLTIKDNSENSTTEIDCQVTSSEPTNSEALVSNIINQAARVAFEDYLRSNPKGGTIVQRAAKQSNGKRIIKPPGL